MSSPSRPIEWSHLKPLDDLVASVSKVLETMTREQVVEFYRRIEFCWHCGSNTSAHDCYCMRDD